MSDLDDIVEVTVSTEAGAIAEPNFGLPIFVGYHEQWTERVRSYSSEILTGLAADGFATESSVYKGVAALLMQDPKVPEVLVGRRANAPTQVIAFEVPDAVVGKTYGLTVAGEGGGEVSYTAQSGDTAADIAAGLKADFDALALDITTTTPTLPDALLCTADNPGDVFTFTNYPNLRADDRTADPGLAADLNAIFLENDDGYCVLGDWQSKAQILAAAANIQPRVKLYLPDVSDNEASSSIVTDDTLSELMDLNYTRVGGFYLQSVGAFQGAAWAGTRLTTNPGAATWMFASPVGIAVDKLTSAQKSAIKAKRGNYFTRRGGFAMVQEGWSASGKFLDERRFLDWYTARLQTHVFRQFVSNPKVPYTEEGIALLKHAIGLANADGVNAGGIDGKRSIVITMPKITSVSSQDKAARILRNVKVSFYLAGAIHRTVMAFTAQN